MLGLQAILKSRRIKQISLETLRGFYATQAIIALLNVGLFDELAKQESIDIATFTAEKDLDTKVLQSLCDYLYELNILDYEDGRIRLDTDGELILNSMSGIYQLTYAYEEITSNLESILRKEKTVGVDIKRRSEYVSAGSGSIGRLLAFPMMNEEIRQRNFQHVLDLGCGDGTFLIELCKKNTSIQGYGLDIAPAGVAAGTRQLQKENLQDRIQLFVGDVMNIAASIDKLQSVDAVTSVYVMHEFQGQIVNVLRNFKAALPRVPLILCEVIRHSPQQLRKKPGGIMEIQLFHELSNQKLFTLEEWQTMFEQAGFTDIQQNYLSFARTCIFTIC